MKIKIDLISYQLENSTKSILKSNQKVILLNNIDSNLFTDNGLINFGKSLKNILALTLISLNI